MKVDDRVRDEPVPPEVVPNVSKTTGHTVEEVKEKWVCVDRGHQCVEENHERLGSNAAMRSWLQGLHGPRGHSPLTASLEPWTLL